MNNNKDLITTINNSKFVNLLKSENYPVAIREGINNILINIIDKEKQITDLYPTILAETPISTSQFQDKCVQYDQHFTPHKRLRQAVMEMQNRLDALYAAKTGHKKAILKVERIKLEIENLEEALKDPENTKSDERRLQLSVLEKQVDLEEAQRGLNASSHLIKDALLKVHQQQNLVDKYQKEVEESGMSYEESEVVFYVLYFSSEMEKQLRTGGRVDTGTFGAISQLPTPIRLKVLKNLDFMQKKLDEGYPLTADYMHLVYRDEMVPKKTGENEFEGMNLHEFLGCETIKILAITKDNEEE